MSAEHIENANEPNNENNNENNDKTNNDTIDETDNDINLKNESASLESALKDVLSDAKFPNPNTVVTGALDAKKVAQASDAGIEHIINLQPNDKIAFDEQAEAEAHSIGYTHIPIDGVNGLKQVNLLAFDRALRMNHGKKVLIHCTSGNIVGACEALRAGWLRGRKMDTAMQRGYNHGLKSELEEEVRMRLLVPR